LTKYARDGPPQSGNFPGDFADAFERLTKFFDRRDIERMGMRVECEGMQVRLKAPRIGDVVTVVNAEVYFYLPKGLTHRTQAVLVGRAPGRYIVEALGRTWNIAMQCVEHEKELMLNGRWLDQWDRRVRRARAHIDRIHTLEKMKSARRRQA
jgi:hypothetical protein